MYTTTTTDKVIFTVPDASTYARLLSGELKPVYRLPGARHDELTEREREVIELVRQGMTNQEIAERLYRSRETCRKHLYNIYQKLDVGNRTAAVRKYFYNQ